MADNPLKKQKESKKVAKNDKLIDNLSDSDDHVSDIECDTCGVQFTSAKAYESHMQGQKHQKKVTEAKLRAKHLAADKDKSESEEDDDDESDMHCEVCDKHISGYVSYLAHMKGSVHAKNVKKQKLKQQLGKMPEVLDSDGDTDDDSILPKPYARCSTCQKEFSGPEPYDKHIKSAVHKKKVKQSQVVENLKAGHEDGTKDSDDEDLFGKCDVCQKSFSGVVPYKIHMESAGHKKGLEKKKVAEEMKEFYVKDTGYVCKECKKSFLDPLAFKCHLENNSHEKQKAKTALLEFLNAHPEIVIVYPLEKEGSGNESDSDDGTDSSYYLICKLCHVSFSGPESAQDHVKSKKHISAKKEKKILKLIKDQKKKPALDIGDKESKDGKQDKSSANGKQDKSTANGKQDKSSANGKLKNPENSANDADDFELL